MQMIKGSERILPHEVSLPARDGSFSLRKLSLASTINGSITSSLAAPDSAFERGTDPAGCKQFI